jgi:DNA polymerase I - 3''-5'' exonuclease and polymerase domains
MIEFRGTQYDIVTLDFETFYDVGYTLMKIPTSAYVLDPRFKVHMVGIKINDGPTHVYRDDLSIRMAFANINWKRSLLLCHNTSFDGFILTQKYRKKPAGYLDTLGMARAVLGQAVRHNLNTVGPLLGLGAKIDKESLDDSKGLRELPQELADRMAIYCAGDVDLCHAIFWKMYDHFPDSELELLDTTIRMFCEPVLRINRALVVEELEAEVGGKMRAVMECGVGKDVLLSNDKFALELLKHGAKAPMKMSKTTKKATYAFAKTDAGLQELVDDPNPQIAALARARLTVKSTIGETRAQRFIDAHDAGGTMPVLLNYYGAHTGRWSGGNKINLQNLPRQEFLEDKSMDLTTGRLRRALMAPPGKVLVVADSAQIEARINAWLAGQADMVEAFREKRDVYKEFASVLYGVPVDQVTKQMRFVGKICILALGYGMGHDKFHSTMRNSYGIKVDLSTAKTYVDTYRAKNAHIVRFWKQLQNRIPTMALPNCEIPIGPVTLIHEAVRLPNGLFLRYPGLMTLIAEDSWGAESSFQGKRTRTKLYGGLLCENLVQALARVVIGEQMLKVRNLGYRIVTSTHDELVAVCTVKQADKCLARMLKIMSTPPDWAPDLPLAAEGGYAQEYSK